MSTEQDEKIRNAAAYDILSDRTLRYKRNLYITAMFAIAIVLGDIDSNKVTLQGFSFTLPNAKAVIPSGVSMVLLYFLISFFRHARGEYVLWEERIRSRNTLYLTDWKKTKNHLGYDVDMGAPTCGIIKLSAKNAVNGTSISKALHGEVMARQRYYRIFEFGLAVGVGTLSLVMLIGNTICNLYQL